MSRVPTDAEVDAYMRGTQRGRSIVEQEARAAAYGAIRRAAEVARGVDCPCGCHGDLDAKAMRRAIRAAIGSPKV